MDISIEKNIVIAKITEVATKEIIALTGLSFRVVAISTEKIDDPDSVLEMMSVMAKALNLTMDDYYPVDRPRKSIDLKSVAVSLITDYYPTMSLKEIGAIMSMDHTTVIYHRRRATNYIETKEPVFLDKYNKSLEAVAKWIKG